MQPSVKMNNSAFCECVLFYEKNISSFCFVKCQTKAEMASSILKGLVTTDGVNRLRTGSQRLRYGIRPMYCFIVIFLSRILLLSTASRISITKGYRQIWVTCSACTTYIHVKSPMMIIETGENNPIGSLVKVFLFLNWFRLYKAV